MVCAGYTAPSFIDEKLFEAKHVFQDTEADHFREQLAGEITSIDRLLAKRQHRHRSGYADDAKMHFTKEISLTELIESQNPLLIFAEYNKITTTKEERDKFYNLIKTQPKDLDEMFDDLKVLGKRELKSIFKWVGKLHHHFNIAKVKQMREEEKIEK